MTQNQMEAPAPKNYKLLTGADDAAFCQRVSDHLDQGYVLYGPPLMAVLPDGSVKVGQAICLKAFADASAGSTRPNQ